MQNHRNSRKAIKQITLDLIDGDFATRENAVKALDELSWQPTKDAFGVAYWIQKDKMEKCVEMGTPAVAPLIAYMENETSSFSRKKAALPLGRLGDKRAVPILLECVQDDNEYLRKDCVQALGMIGDQQAVPALLNALTDEMISVRGQVVKALDATGWQPEDDKTGATYWMIKFLYAGLGSTDQEREAAGLTLTKLSWQPDQSEAGAAYWIAKGDWKECASMGLPAARPLFAKIQDEDKGVRDAAVNALVEIGQPAAEFISHEIRSFFYTHYSYSDDHTRRARIETARVLGMIADPCAIKPLLAYFNHVERNLDHKRAAADALALIGEPALEPLIQALADKNVHDHQGVAWALGKMGDRRAIPALIDLLSNGRGYRDYERNAVGEALYQLTGKMFGRDGEAWKNWWQEQEQG